MKEKPLNDRELDARGKEVERVKKLEDEGRWCALHHEVKKAVPVVIDIGKGKILIGFSLCPECGEGLVDLIKKTYPCKALANVQDGMVIKI